MGNLLRQCPSEYSLQLRTPRAGTLRAVFREFHTPPLVELTVKTLLSHLFAEGFDYPASCLREAYARVGVPHRQGGREPYR
eukprot:477219-Prorocentrum_minimum.AAC.1